MPPAEPGPSITPARSDEPVRMTGHPSAGRRVAAAGPSLVCPDRPGFAADPVTPPLRLAAALPLGGGRSVGVVADAAGARWTVHLVDDGSGVRRAVAGDGVAQALTAFLGAGDEVVGFDGVPWHAERWHAEPVAGERAMGVDQTNESVVVGERAVVKWNLRLPSEGADGPDGADVPHPAPRRLASLAAAGFTGTARPWGLLSRGDLLLATVTEYLPGAVDGWTWAVDDVRALARGEVTLDAALEPVRTVAGLVAGLHAALAATGRDVLTAAGAAAWADRADADLREALRLVDGPEGERLAARAPAIAAGLAPLAGAAGTPLIDVHGDLHVGQVLRHPRPPGEGGGFGYAIVDLDGNPVLAPAERLARRPVAVDVGGFLASLDHVGRVVVRRTEDVDVAAVERWIDAATAAFLDAYTAALAAAGLVDLLDARLLRPVRLQQECREFHYAARHLPHWRYVPDGALGALLRDPS